VGKIFLSYRRNDSRAEAGRINDQLIRKFGRRAVFLDVDSIPLGEDFIIFLNQEATGCAALLAIIGEDWLEARDGSTGSRRIDDPNDYVRIEIRVALTRGIPVIPVLLDDAVMPAPENLPADIRALSSRQVLRLRSDFFHSDLAPLIRRLDRLPTFQWSLAGLTALAVGSSFAGILLSGSVCALAIAMDNRWSGVERILLSWSAGWVVVLLASGKQAVELSLGWRTAFIWALTSCIILPIFLVALVAWTDGPRAGLLQLVLLGSFLFAMIGCGLFIQRYLRP